MIDYTTYCEIHRLKDQEGLKATQIARKLGFDIKTVHRWLKRPKYSQTAKLERPSKLDPFKGQILHWLNSYHYSAAQVFTKLRELGYEGQYTILRAFIAKVRPKESRAFMTLKFEPGQSAQVDWASFGSVPIGGTKRALSFFVMVLAHSRRLYVEFTLGQKLEHFLACHKNAWDYFGATTREVMVDNCKVAVLHHPKDGPVVYHPRYLDMAQHYGQTIKACTPGQPQQKGRVENAVSYVKKNFLAGRELGSVSSINQACRLWLDTVANQRVHGSTGQKPDELFEQEKSQLQALPSNPYDTGLLIDTRVNRQFRVRLDSNSYSVPPHLVDQKVAMKVYSDKIRIYHSENLVAQHDRSYDRKQDFEQPDHVAPLLAKRYKNRDQRLIIAFLALSPRAELYLKELKARRLQSVHHVRKIMALTEAYGHDPVARAVEDALEFNAFSSEYIINILEQQARRLPEAGVLHLTRREDLLEMDLPEPDLSVYPDTDPNLDQAL
jgi:transposase